ncbi:proline-rich domain-containing protein [Streptomyces sp. NPDC091377]|uniref:proline-rich domain-containing protein n=1 Tax=unclassified Streptomyces TaxID=2593676 RepID=UPI0037FAF009
MSFGDPNPNNPYGAPQGGQQQPGYPEQQQPGQPGYGYPQAPPVGAYAGAPAPTTMPGTVNTARILLWVIVGLQVIGTALYGFAAVAANSAEDDETLGAIADYPVGLMWGIAFLALAWLVWAAVLATKFNSGGNGVRITILVFGILTAVFALIFTVLGVVHIVMGILIAIFAGNANGKAWFNRPRY